MKTTARWSILFLIVMLAFMQVAGADMVVKEDFTGDGQFLIFTAGWASDRALCLNGSLAYGRSLTISGDNSSLFSGFNLDGLGSYRISSPDHFLAVARCQGINATSSIAIGQDRSTMFRLKGRGEVRERVLTSGPKGRPVEVSSLYSSGSFRINSSTRSSGEDSEKW